MHKVRNFVYDGLGGMLEPGYVGYTAELLRWTLDPGVGLFRCSDGKERLIPTFALAPGMKWEKPEDTPEDYTPIMYIGPSSRS